MGATRIGGWAVVGKYFSSTISTLKLKPFDSLQIIKAQTNIGQVREYYEYQIAKKWC